VNKEGAENVECRAQVIGGLLEQAAFSETHDNNAEEHDGARDDCDSAYAPGAARQTE
jgi:hypothetical protein